MISDKCISCGVCCFINPCFGKEVTENPNYEWIIKNKDKLILIGDQYWFAPPNHICRCKHLVGNIENCYCDIYDDRPPFCREYPRNEKEIEFCNQLRTKYGIGTISIKDFKEVK